MKYIDTSAFIKYYSNEDVEKGADKIRTIIDRAKKIKKEANVIDQKDVLISSILLIGESISVFDKWLRLKLITKKEFDELLAVFLGDIKLLLMNNAFVFEEINSFMAISCCEYIIKHNLTLNDSFHLYGALLNKAEIDEFICSDKNLIEAVKKEGIKIFNPEE